jgi:hypothetical protein
MISMLWDLAFSAALAGAKIKAALPSAQGLGMLIYPRRAC